VVRKFALETKKLMRSLCPTDIANKECKSDHGSGGPQKAYFLAYIIHRYNPMGFVMREAKRDSLATNDKGP
jgi:hypothetical protein